MRKRIETSFMISVPGYSRKLSGVAEAGLFVAVCCLLDCIRDDPGQREVFSTERMLEFETSNVDAFASGRAAYTPVMVPRDQPEFRRTTWYSILEAESQRPERPFSDHFLLLGPIEVGADDD